MIVNEIDLMSTPL